MTAHESVRAGRVVDGEVHLLDRQVLDVTGTPVAAVDDVALSDVPLGEDFAPGTAAPVIEDLLSGPLATRIFGGRPPFGRWHRIPWSTLTEIGPALHVSARGEELDSTWSERWLRDHVIARIPGGRHAPE
jgi:hypothetical protein